MSGLGQTAREYLREAGCERAYADGAVVVRRGEPGGAFYVVVSGAVDVLLVADDGRRLPLARLGEGSSFGEMSLLTGEAVSADVVARGGATLLVYPGEQFQTALAECAELRSHILVRLCENLHRTSTKAWDLFQRAEALRTLVHATERAWEASCWITKIDDPSPDQEHKLCQQLVIATLNDPLVALVNSIVMTPLVGVTISGSPGVP